MFLFLKMLCVMQAPPIFFLWFRIRFWVRGRGQPQPLPFLAPVWAWVVVRQPTTTQNRDAQCVPSLHVLCIPSWCK